VEEEEVAWEEFWISEEGEQCRPDQRRGGEKEREDDRGLPG